MRYLSIIIVALIMCSASFYFIEKAFSIPVAYWSLTEKRCLAIENEGNLTSCAPMPEKYYVKYVD